MCVSEIDRSEIERRLSPTLQYACCYWVHDVKLAEDLFSDPGNISDFLCGHLLHWLEALSLIRKTTKATRALESLAPLTVSKHVGAYQRLC
jgi:hypothetical protein